MYGEIYAKSNGSTLYEHSREVLNLGMRVGNYLIRNSDYKEKKDILSKLAIALILHDIGKCTDSCQNIIKNNKIEEPTYHNIYSWAFFLNYINGSSLDENAVIGNAILYHHPLRNDKIQSSDDVTFSIKELEVMREIYEALKDYAEDVYDISTENQFGFEETHSRPVIVEEERIYGKISRDSAKWRKSIDRESYKQILRTILVFADRCVSSGQYDNEKIFNNDYHYMMDNIILPQIMSNKDDFNEVNIFELKNRDGNPLYDTSRLTKQAEVVNYINDWNSNENNTLIVQATAGFGKTMIGIMWALTSKQKTIWVTPRNAIATSTYSSIVDELNNIGETKIKVGLFFSGEYIHKNYDYEGEPDILVTNIDSILYRHIRNDKQLLLFNAYANNVVFDEYHEFKSDEPLFSGFIRMLYTRKNFLNTKTMMLSATPLDFSSLYGNEYVEIYNKPLHLYNDMKVNISVKEFETLADFKCGKDSFVVVPSVSWAQGLYEEDKGNDIVHSRYTEEDRMIKERKLITRYGKRANVSEKGIVFGTNVIGVGLDISCQNMYDFFITPEDTVQRGCGRTGRFNEKEYNGVVNYTICILKDKRYKRYIKERINEESYLALYNKWLDIFKSYDGKTITKGEIYSIWNKFYEDNAKDINDKYESLFEKSDENITGLYLTSVKNKVNKNRKVINNSNSYRTTDSIFVTTKNNKGEYINPITLRESIVINNESDDDASCKRRKDYIESNKNFNMNMITYAYRIKRFGIQDCMNLAYKNDTPFLLLNARYDNDKGLQLLGKNN